MLAFRSAHIVPPGGRYFYEPPGHNIVITDLTRSGFLNKVKAFYGANDESVPEDLWLQVQDFMCRRLPTGFCYGDVGEQGRLKVFTIQQIRQRTQELVQQSPKVLIGEAERRARVCGICELNDRSACPGCIGLTKWCRRLTGRDLKGYEEWLGVCTVDGAALAGKIHVKNIPEGEYPANCWRSNET